MKHLVIILLSVLFFSSCSTKDTYQMPNYFKHHENGNVKQITIRTSEVRYGGITPSMEDAIIIWGEPANATYTYAENGNILSDKYYDYVYDEEGRLISANNKTPNVYGVKSTHDFKYNELNEIKEWSDNTFRYNDNNQICEVTEIYPATNGFPASHRVYEYNDDGQMKSCNFNYNKSIYGSEYDENGDLKRHVQLMEYGRVQEYNVSVTKRDDKGNWTERRITGTDYNGTPVEYIQTRELRYY